MSLPDDTHIGTMSIASASWSQCLCVRLLGGPDRDLLQTCTTTIDCRIIGRYNINV